LHLGQLFFGFLNTLAFAIGGMAAPDVFEVGSDLHENVRAPVAAIALLAVVIPILRGDAKCEGRDDDPVRKKSMHTSPLPPIIAAGFDTMARGRFSEEKLVYIAIVLLLMLILPGVSLIIEQYIPAHQTGLLPLIGKWYVFWAVGVRLMLAAIRQIANPRYTAEVILGLKTREPWIVVRELGFANLAIGAIAAGSLAAPTWLTPSAVAGAIFYGLAGMNHFFKKDRNRLENVALVSDLFACAVLCCYCAAAIQAR
jgi:hypothetical protein